MKQLLIIAVMSLASTVSFGASAGDANTREAEQDAQKSAAAQETEDEAPSADVDDAETPPETPSSDAVAGEETQSEDATKADASQAETERSAESDAETAEGAEKGAETSTGAAATDAEAEPATPATEPAKPVAETTTQVEAEKTPKDAGPPAPVPGPRFSLQPDPPYTAASLAEYDRQYKKNRRLQVMGKSMLAASFAMELVGAIVIEAAPFGPVGWAAFGVIGTGVAHFIASAFMLGFSKPPHHLTPPRREVAAEAGSKDIIF